MADISKITLPDGSTYTIKDSVARSNSGVTGVKGNVQSTYRTGNVNLTPANIGAYAIVDRGQGTTDVALRPYIDQARANRLVFLPANQIIIEKTTDGGTTWVDAGISDSLKISIFAEGGGSGITIPLLNNAKSTNCGLRVTITGMKYNVPENTPETQKYSYWNTDYINSCERYFNVREWWFWISSNNDRIRPEIYCATGANPNTWVTVFNQDFRMYGWSGSDWIKVGGGKTFGGGTTQTTNYWNWRILFWSAPAAGSETFASNTIQSIAQIRCYGDSVWVSGNNLAARDHLYSWDSNKNAIFPAAVTATNFAGKINGYTVSKDVPSNAVFTDTKNTAGSINSNSKLFLIGATTQAANPQTYSHDTAYIGTDGCLYSDEQKVVTVAGGTINGALHVDNSFSANSAEIGNLVVTGDASFTNGLRGDLTGTVNGNTPIQGGSNAASTVTITPTTASVYSMTSAGSVTAGTATVPAQIDTTKFSGGSLVMAMDTTDTKKLNITFTAGSLASGFYTAGTQGTPTSVALPTRSASAINVWTGYSTATAAAQTFTGTPC